jgi:hypothetical protein
MRDSRNGTGRIAPSPRHCLPTPPRRASCGGASHRRPARGEGENGSMTGVSRKGTAILTQGRGKMRFISCRICRAKSHFVRRAQVRCTSRAQVLHEKDWFLRALRANTLPRHPRGIDFSNEIQVQGRRQKAEGRTRNFIVLDRLLTRAAQELLSEPRPLGSDAGADIVADFETPTDFRKRLSVIRLSRNQG